MKLSSLVLGSLAIILPTAISCSSTNNSLSIANGIYSTGFTSFNPLSVSDDKQANLHAAINDTLFYTDRFNNIQGGLAKDLEDGGLKVSTTLNGDDFQDYDIANPQTGIKRWKVFLRDGSGNPNGNSSDNQSKPVFVDYAGNYVEDLKPKHFVNTFIFYLSGYTGTSMLKMMNNQHDQGSAKVLSTYFGNEFTSNIGGFINAASSTVNATIYYKEDANGNLIVDEELTNINTTLPTNLYSLEESIYYARIKALSFIIPNNDDNTITYISDSPTMLNLFLSTAIAPIPDYAIKLDSSNRHMGIVDNGFQWKYATSNITLNPQPPVINPNTAYSGSISNAIPASKSYSLYGVGMLKKGEETNNDFSYNAQKYAYYTGHFLPQKNGFINNDKIVLTARNKKTKLHVPNYSSILTYNYKIINNFNEQPDIERVQFENNKIDNFTLNNNDNFGIEKYLGNIENPLLPKSNYALYNDPIEYNSPSWNLIPLAKTGSYSVSSDMTRDSTSSKNYDKNSASWVDRSQYYLYNNEAGRNNTFLRDIRGRAYFAYNFNRSLLSTYFTTFGSERPNYVNAVDPLDLQVPSLHNSNKISSVGAFNNLEKEYVDFYLENALAANDLVADPNLVKNNLANGSEIDQYYHNYNVGIKIFNTDNSDKALFESAYSNDHTILERPNDAFTAIANAISPILPLTGDYITLYLPIPYAKEKLPNDYIEHIDRLIDNFNSVPNAKVYLVAQYCDLNTQTNESYNAYATFQPLTYNGNDENGNPFAHVKYADFVWIDTNYFKNINPKDFWIDSLNYYKDNGFFKNDDLYTNYSSALTSANNIATDQFLAFSAIEADVLANLYILPFYSIANHSYSITKYTPFTRSLINNGSSNRLATGGKLNSKPITNKEYYRKKYILDKICNENNNDFEWSSDPEFIKQYGQIPVENSSEWKDIVANLQKNWLL